MLLLSELYNKEKRREETARLFALISDFFIRRLEQTIWDELAATKSLFDFHSQSPY